MKLRARGDLSWELFALAILEVVSRQTGQLAVLEDWSSTLNEILTVECQKPAIQQDVEEMDLWCFFGLLTQEAAM